MSSALPNYLSCNSPSVVKNGFIHNGKQNHRCNDCGRQFVEDPQNQVISDETLAHATAELGFQEFCQSQGESRS